MWDRIAIKQQGKNAIKTNYWKTFFASLLMLIFSGSTTFYFASNAIDTLPESLGDIMNDATSDHKVIALLFVLVVSLLVISTFIKTMFSVFIKNPVRVGFSKFLYKTVQARDLEDQSKGLMADNFWAFDHNYLNIVKVMFVQGFIEIAGYFLFIIPGIYFFYEFRMVPYILSENPDLSIKETLQTSKEMVKGHKKDLLLLDLSFIPWHLLGLVTFGVIELFHVLPYFHLTLAEAYRVLSTEYYREEK